MTDTTRQLGLAASSQKIGFAFFIGREVVDWGLAHKASKDVDAAFAQTRRWLRFYRPTRIFIEAVDGGTRKGQHSIALIHVFAAAGMDHGISVITVQRRMHHRNKYVEAAALAEQHPHLKPFVPKPRAFWVFEPHRMVFFEAIALVEEWYASQGNAGAKEVDEHSQVRL